MQFEKRNNLPATGKLDSHMFAALTREHGGAQHRLQHAEPARGRAENTAPTQPTPAPGAGGNGAAGRSGGQRDAAYRAKAKPALRGRLRVP